MSLSKRLTPILQKESDREIARKLWISRKSVAKYREDILETLSKEDRLKQELVKTYSPEELKGLLTHLQTSTAKSIEKVIWDKGHLKFALVSDTHLGNKQSAKERVIRLL